MTRVLLALALVLPFGGCGDVVDDDGGINCTAVFVYGLNVTLEDDSTGLPIAGATLTLREGAYEEVMDELMPGTYVGAGERAGTYELTAEASGYTGQVLSDIVITADECHVMLEALEIRLTPAP